MAKGTEHLRNYAKKLFRKRNIAAITENISKIRSLYVSAIALTPVTPVDIMNSSFNPNDPYASVSFDELDKELGTEAELRKLVDEVHANKMKILLEFDISYTGVNHPWRTNHVDYYLTNDKKKMIFTTGILLPSITAIASSAKPY